MEPPHATTDPPTSRLAPSPTGDLHLGNVRTFLINWSLARNLDWRLVLRHEDLDVRRASVDKIDAIEDSLRWLGLDWDGPSIRQSDDLAPYHAAMKVLAGEGRVFRSQLSRRDVREAIEAPHAGGEIRFPPELRPEPGPEWAFEHPSDGHRYAMPAGEEIVRDQLLGEHVYRPSDEIGDPVVWTREGCPAYQLAVVVDDHEHRVSDVIRGEDLLSSAARQQRLGRALEFDLSPRWWHLPLVSDGEGRRLAKRDGDRGLQWYADRGVTPARIIGLIGYRSGLRDDRTPMTLQEFMRTIDVESLRSLVDRERAAPCRILDEDHDWLVS